MANLIKGEVEVVLDGKKFDVFLPNRALAEVQSEFGVKGFEDAFDFTKGLPADHFSRLLKAICRGNRAVVAAMSKDEISEAVDDLPLSYTTEVIFELAAAAFPKSMTSAELAEATGGRPLATKKGGRRG